MGSTGETELVSNKEIFDAGGLIDSRSESVHFLVLTSLQLVASATMAQLNLLTRRGVKASHAHGRDLMATASNLQVKPYAVVKRGCWRQIEKSSRISVRLTTFGDTTLPTPIAILLSQLHALYDVIILTFCA